MSAQREKQADTGNAAMAGKMGWIGKNPNEVSYNNLENPRKRRSVTFLSNVAIYAYGNSNGDKKKITSQKIHTWVKTKMKAL